MLQSGVNSKSLSEATNINTRTICNAMAGRSTIGVDKALSIAKALDTTVEELFSMGGDSNE